MSEPYRVVVIEDDVDVAIYTRTVLEKRLGCVVAMVTDPRRVQEAVGILKPDVVITDIEMPGVSGLDLIAGIRELQPDVPVIVMTAHVSVDYAVGALRNHANEFLTKPVSSADLVSHVSRLAEASRQAAANAPERQVVLAIGAHPDDIEVGVGGILAAHRAAGEDVTLLTLSRGMRDGGVRTAWEEGSASAASIGATLILEDTGDQQSTESMIDVVRRVVAEVNPTVVYVHSATDRHLDHRKVHDATIVATGAVRTVACYQGSTATVEFHPNRFVTIDGFTDAKLGMLAHFAANTERPAYLDAGLALATARYWSRFGEGQYCEPLEIVRESGQVTG
ncbi:response regulator [Marisediminicola senii]|uniref:response regulator n=1 Tax=Marisediminicola senii TaxID=2711233 RepID=UPI0013EA3227|nr:response regulator [Marisediminicola senii]